MFVAVQEGNEGRIATLLDTDPALLEAMDGMKNTPVIVAANDGELGVVRLLVQRGANIHATGHSGRTALHVAALMDFEVVAAFLLGSGAHASCKDKQGCTPLILASSRGLMGAVDVLVEHLRASGTDLEEGDAKGRTALHWAAEEGQELVVAFLLRSGAQAGCSDNGGVTPLMLASGKGLGGVAHLLVEYLEAPGLEQRDAKGRTALHWAAEQGQELMVAFLLRNGAQAESSAPDGMTPLMCASCKGHVAVVRVLAQHMSQEGLGLEQRDAQASTALHWATINGHADVIRLLLKNGAQATCRDVWGNTPLMTAAYHNQMPAVRILLSVLGIQELDEADTRGWTALHLAARSRGGEEIVRLLLLHGADPSRVDHRGQTPRAAAQRLQRETCVAVFEVRSTCRVCFFLTLRVGNY